MSRASIGLCAIAFALFLGLNAIAAALHHVAGSLEHCRDNSSNPCPTLRVQVLP